MFTKPCNYAQAPHLAAQGRLQARYTVQPLLTYLCLQGHINTGCKDVCRLFARCPTPPGPFQPCNTRSTPPALAARASCAGCLLSAPPPPPNPTLHLALCTACLQGALERHLQFYIRILHILPAREQPHSQFEKKLPACRRARS